MTDVLLIAPFGPAHVRLTAELRDGDYDVTRLDAAASFLREMRFLLPPVAVVHAELEECDGIRLVEQACRQGSPTAFVVTTSTPSELGHARAIAAGATHYVLTERALPVILAELRAAEPSAAAACERRACFCLDGLEFDREMRTVIVKTCDSAQTSRLSPKETALLWLLIRHEGEIVARPELRRALYGPSDTIGRRRIDQLVHRVRARLEPPSATHRYLHTHADGYGFWPEQIAATGLS